MAGGVAAIFYGNPRFTKDLDLWVDLEEENLKRLVRAFKKLRFVPRIPVKAEEFVSEANRERFINPKNPFENVDILFRVPFSFEKAYKDKKVFKSEKTPIPTVSAKILIAMKRQAGRKQDLEDIKILKEATR